MMELCKYIQALLLHVHKLDQERLLIDDQVNKWPLWASATSCKHNIDVLSPCNVVKVNVLANSGSFAYPTGTEKHYI